MTVSVTPPIDRLLRGIATNDVETVRDAWRELLADKTGAVPAVLAKLASHAWEYNPRGPLPRYLGVLLSLLDELDPSVFEREIKRLLATPLHPLHRKTVAMLAHRCQEQPKTHIGPCIPVYVAVDIADRSEVVRNLENWSRTVTLELAGVTRIDVIARHPHLDYLGLYNLFFSGIILTWPAARVPGWHRWWRRLDAEFTFYHEVGHHTCGHIEGGSVVEQEQEANDYARKMMRQAHPILSSIARAVLFPFKPLLRPLVARLETADGQS